MIERMCDKQNCFNKAEFRPQVFLYPIGADKEYVDPVILDFNVVVCPSDCSYNPDSLITDEGWMQIQLIAEAQGLPPMDRYTLEIVYKSLGED